MTILEAQITIRRTDPRELASDFEAVTHLLEQRKAERIQMRADSAGKAQASNLRRVK